MKTNDKSASGAPRTSGTALYPGRPGFKPAQPVPVGGLVLESEGIDYNVGRKTVTLTVRNTGDRPIQVGSHFHFFEVNRYLEFDRDAAFGCHLNIPATTAVRFEPGDQKQVEVVAYAGKRRVIGFNGLVMGYTGDEDAPGYFPARLRAMRRVRNAGFRITGEQVGVVPEVKAPAAQAPQASAAAAARAQTAKSAPASAQAGSAPAAGTNGKPSGNNNK